MKKVDEEKEIMWRKLLPEEAYLRLKESDTGLHLKVGLLAVFRKNNNNSKG